MKKLEKSMAFGSFILLAALLMIPLASADDPEIETLDAEEVNYTSATLRGWVNTGDIEEVNLSFHYEEDELSEDLEEVYVGTMEDAGTFNKTINGLDNDTTYEFRAVAKWNEGLNSTEGNVFEFTTEAYPSVETKDAEDITHNSAVLKGNLTETGVEDDVNTYFNWTEDGEGEWQETEGKEVTEEGSFDEELEGLDYDTKYEFRAVIGWGDENVTEGDIQTFETEPEIYVRTLEPEEITTNSALLRGELLGNEGKIGEELTNVSFKYLTTGEDPVETEEESMDSTGKFSSTVTGLDSETEYTFRAILELEEETREGDSIKFSTAPEVELDNLEADPKEVYVDEQFDISVDVENLGENEYEYDVVFYVDGSEEDVKTVTISGGGTETVKINTSISSSGDYEIEVEVVGESIDTEVEVYNTPEVYSLTPVEIGSDYAVLKGEVVEIGLEEDVRVFFRYGDQEEDEEYWAESGKQTIDYKDFLMGYGTFEKEVSLEVDIEYGYKAVLTWDGGDREDTGSTRNLAPDACYYGEWENVTCGGWECDDDEVYQIKEVTDASPDFCRDIQERCLSAEDYCGEPDIDVEQERNIVNVTAGEWQTNNITVENTGTRDLKGLNMGLEAGFPEDWFSIQPSNFDLDQKDSGDFMVNFTPLEGAPVGKYPINYTFGPENLESAGGELWVHPQEGDEVGIEERYQSIEDDTEYLEDRFQKLAKETDVDHVDQKLSNFRSLLTAAEEAIGRDDYVTAEEKISEAESLRFEIIEEMDRIEEELAIPWLWILSGVLGIILVGLLIYMLLPPKEGYDPDKGYSSPSQKSTRENFGDLKEKVKEKVFGDEEDEGYTYKG